MRNIIETTRKYQKGSTPRLWVQQTKRKALKLNEFWRFYLFLLEHYLNI